jgi:hypothetical protein
MFLNKKIDKILITGHQNARSLAIPLLLPFGNGYANGFFVSDATTSVVIVNTNWL